MTKENPCTGIKKNQEKARKRYLTDDELKRFLKELDRENERDLALALKFLLMTGCRRSEALTLKWTDVDLSRNCFFLHETKNGESRTVILNDMAREIIDEMLKRKQADNPYVFPSKTSSSGHFEEPKRLFKNICDRAEIADFRVHDLRHSFASLLVNNGVSLYQIKDLLGHKDIRMTQRYASLSNNSLLAASQVASEKIKQLSL